MEYLTDAKKLLSLIEDGASTRELTDFELDALSDYVVTEGINYETLPDGLKFKTAFATRCKQRGILLPDIVMYYCFN